MSAPIFAPILLVDVEIFHLNLTHLWLQRKGQGVAKVIRIHLLGTMNVIITFHYNLSNIC